MLNAARERSSAVKWYPESPPMTEFKDKIPTGGGKVEYLYSPDGRRATRISGFMRAVYMVAVSMDGRRLLSTIPAGGIGHVAVYLNQMIVRTLASNFGAFPEAICARLERSISAHPKFSASSGS
jgi:hypothetical protein